MRERGRRESIHNPDGRSLSAKLSLAKGCLPPPLAMSRIRNTENKRFLNVALELVIRTPQKLTHSVAAATASPLSSQCSPSPWPPRKRKGPHTPKLSVIVFQRAEPRLCQQQGREGNETGPPHCVESLPSNRQMVPSVPGRSGWPKWTLTPQAIQYFVLTGAERDNISDLEKM